MLKIDVKFVEEVFGTTECITREFCSCFKTMRIYGNGKNKLLVVRTNSFADTFDYKEYLDMFPSAKIEVTTIRKKKHTLFVFDIYEENCSEL